MLKCLINDLTCHLNNYSNLKTAIHHIVNYKSDDWKKYINIPETGYQRITLYSCIYFEIILICWSPKSESPIHDHSKNGCLMKILEGCLEEELYDTNIIKTNHFIRTKNDVNYIDNSIGYHKIYNNYFPTYSLHIYSPINHSAQIFDE